MLPCYSSRFNEKFITVDDYYNNTNSSVKKISPPPPPPMSITTDHSQRIGKLLPYISSMVNKSVKVYFEIL
jgi:hypothetical protein